MSAKALDSDTISTAIPKTVSIETPKRLSAITSQTASLEENGETPDEEDDGNGIITRAQWLKTIEDTFDMSVDEENYPDNYFSDVTTDSANYYTMILAEEFGLIDVDAGEEVHPDDPATREFAAQTLNYVLGYQLAQGETYTYLDTTETTYRDDAQIALDRGWFEPVNSKFCPDMNITEEEKALMLDDAEKTLASVNVDTNHDNVYEFADDVIEIPKGTNVYVREDNVVTITGYSGELKAGDRIAVWPSTMPVIYEIANVTSDDDTLTVTTTDSDCTDSVVSVDSSGMTNMDLSYFVGADDVKVTYNQSTFNSSGTGSTSAKSSGTTHTAPSINVEKTLKISSGVNVTVRCDLSNLQISHTIKDDEFYVSVTGDTKLTASTKLDLVKEFNGSSNIKLGSVRVAGVGKVELSVDLALNGKLTAEYSGNFTAGMQYVNDQFRLVKSFHKKSFSTTAEAEAQIGLKVSAGIDLVALKGSIFAKSGLKATIYSHTYGDGKKPERCTQINAWLYVQIGAEASFLSKSWNKTIDIYDKSNSPVRISFHYEDGKQVSACTRKEKSEKNKSWSNYVTPADSQYASSSYNGTSSTGEDKDGNAYILWTYEINNEGKANIKKYYGNARVLQIPDELDGYKVVGINSSAFEKNEMLREVIFGENVVSVGSYAFNECKNLSSVVLPNGLESLGTYVFEETAISSITIPKTLKTADNAFYYNDYAGPFAKAAHLSEVTFEQGIQTIPEFILSCSNVAKLNIPDGVTVIGEYAFHNCTKLTEVNYLGSKEDWSKITIGSNNEALNPEIIHYHNHTYTSVVTAPTCTEQGYTVYTCSSCGYSYKGDYTDATGHKPVTDAARPATCSEPGLTEGSHCSVCNEVLVKQETIPQLAHTYTEKTTKRATCEEDGIKTYTCSVCGESHTEPIPATGHDYSISFITKKPTCIEEGVRTYTCVNCGGSKTESIPTVDHDYEPHVTDPTATEMGYTTYICKICGDSYKTAFTPPLGESTSAPTATPTVKPVTPSPSPSPTPTVVPLTPEPTATAGPIITQAPTASPTMTPAAIQTDAPATPTDAPVNTISISTGSIWDKLLSFITFGQYEPDITVSIDSTLGNNAKIFYYIDKSGSEQVISIDDLAYTVGPWIKYSGEFVLNDPKNVVYAKIVDTDTGKVYYICSDGIELKAAETAEPTAKPTSEPTSKPTATPTQEPTSEPTATPTAEPTSEPTATPTAEPTSEPTAKPTAEPTSEPTAKPTTEPTSKPTAKPTTEPTSEPTAKPTAEPTSEPTATPTAEPTSEPTAVPTAEPTSEPTTTPTSEPTTAPTKSPAATVDSTPTPAATTAPQTSTSSPATPSPTPANVIDSDIAASASELEVGDTYTDTAANARYKITSTNAGSETVTYLGTTNKKAVDITIPDSVTINGRSYKVTAIADNAFKGNIALRKVTIGKNVETIGTGAFAGCRNLVKVTIKGNALRLINSNAFRYCSKLTGIIIGTKVTTIGRNAFMGCKSLKSILIKSEKLNKIYKYAFKGINVNGKITVLAKYYIRYKKMIKKSKISNKIRVVKKK